MNIIHILILHLEKKKNVLGEKIAYWKKLKEEICCSPFYSILVDGSTKKTMEKHLIVYITCLPVEGRNPCEKKI